MVQISLKLSKDELRYLTLLLDNQLTTEHDHPNDEEYDFRVRTLESILTQLKKGI